MKRIEIKPNDKYGDLTVVREVESKGKRHVLCKCACGNEATVRLGHLRSGLTLKEIELERSKQVGCLMVKSGMGCQPNGTCNRWLMMLSDWIWGTR